MSTAVVDSQKLYAWCKGIVNDIVKERVAKTAQLVVEEQKRAARGRWWRRAQTLTYDQARARVESDDYASDWALAETYGWRLEETCKKLMASCLVSERVTVSSDDLERLHYWSPALAETIFKQAALR